MFSLSANRFLYLPRQELVVLDASTVGDLCFSYQFLGLVVLDEDHFIIHGFQEQLFWAYNVLALPEFLSGGEI